MQAAKRSQLNGGRAFPSLRHRHRHRPRPPPPTICSSEASASSAIASEAPHHSSAQSGCRRLQEEDYIGMANISSTASMAESEATTKVRIEEPDLRLGLGPSPPKEADDNGSLHPFPQPKKPKRLFSDAIASAPAYANPGAINEALASGAINEALTSGAAGAAAQHDVNLSPPPQQNQGMYWGVFTGSSWSSNAGNNGSMPVKHNHGSISMKNGSIECSLQRALDENPPSKERVIGWPPVRSYRRTAINVGQSRSAGTDADAQGANYVKVNMDGIPVGRKVDLNSYNNYDELLCALERMFNTPPVGAGGNSLQEREFVLTYEDKEGDWMLVGDVPWGMFIKVVKRLRITRASDATCVGSTESKNFASAMARIHR